MKNDHATKKQKKQKQQTATPVGTQQLPSAEVAGPEPGTCNLQPATDPPPPQETDTPPAGSQRRRNGNVARLPKIVRDQINQMILDGVPYAQIIIDLGDQAKNINEDSLSNWRPGGYEDWLKEQQRVEDCRISQELTLDLAREREGIESFQAPNKIASALICEALADVGADTFRKALADPHTCLRLLNTLSRITAAGLRCERHLADEADRKNKLTQPKASKKGDGSAISRKRIEQEYHLFPRNPNPSEPIRTVPNLSEPNH